MSDSAKVRQAPCVEIVTGRFAFLCPYAQEIALCEFTQSDTPLPYAHMREMGLFHNFGKKYRRHYLTRTCAKWVCSLVCVKSHKLDYLTRTRAKEVVYPLL